jgi:hypothetical protein
MVTVTNNLLIFQVFMATLKLDKLQYPGHLGYSTRVYNESHYIYRDKTTPMIL